MKQKPSLFQTGEVRIIIPRGLIHRGLRRFLDTDKYDITLKESSGGVTGDFLDDAVFKADEHELTPDELIKYAHLEVAYLREYEQRINRLWEIFVRVFIGIEASILRNRNKAREKILETEDISSVETI